MTHAMLATAVAGLALAGCVGIGGQRVPDGLVQFELKKTIEISPGRAHAKFQRGRQVGGVNRYAPWCELEIRTVSETTQQVGPANIPVGRLSQAFIKDYLTRAPALLGGLSCDDLVFQETTWWVPSESESPAVYLRCFAPYTNCRFGPPLSPEQIQDVVGPTLEIRVNHRL
jgi:hypothetical protein